MRQTHNIVLRYCAAAFDVALATTLLFAGISCKQQPFEPEGPTGNKLIVYGILSGELDTQYVRLATTFSRGGESPVIEKAIVTYAPNCISRADSNIPRHSD